MFTGTLELDVLLGAVGSLKHKRAVIRPVLARLRRLDVAVCEAGDQQLHRRALIGIAVSQAIPVTCSRYWTPASGSWQTNWSWNCCPPDGGFSVRRTDFGTDGV